MLYSENYGIGIGLLGSSVDFKFSTMNMKHINSAVQ